MDDIYSRALLMAWGWLGGIFCVGISEENGMYYIALYWIQEGRVEDALSAGSDAEGGKF